MTTKIKYCPNNNECDGNCLDVTEIIKDNKETLDNVYEFIVSWFEDDENIQPIKNKLEEVITTLDVISRLKF